MATNLYALYIKDLNNKAAVKRGFTVQLNYCVYIQIIRYVHKIITVFRNFDCFISRTTHCPHRLSIVHAM